jgi:hypothetical protein
MWEAYANMLGHHAARILSRIANGGPFTTLLGGPPREQPVYALAVRIDFEGVLAETRLEVGGHIICGLARFADIRPLLTDVAAYLGSEATVLEIETGPQDILNEFVNIVIGLTGASWTEHGFEMNFSTPRALSGLIPPTPSPADHAFNLAVSAGTGLKVDIMVVFSDHGRPAL